MTGDAANIEMTLTVQVKLTSGIDVQITQIPLENSVVLKVVSL